MPPDVQNAEASAPLGIQKQEIIYLYFWAIDNEEDTASVKTERFKELSAIDMSSGPEASSVSGNQPVTYRMIG
jgi:hypothetical protein